MDLRRCLAVAGVLGLLPLGAQGLGARLEQAERVVAAHYRGEALEAQRARVAARVEALEAIPAQLADLQQRLADLEAAVSQIQGLTEEAVSQSVEKALKAVEGQVQPLTKEMVKAVLLVAEALKKTNMQRL